MSDNDPHGKSAGNCPACGKRDLDGRGICWRKECGFRRCESCGKNTGSQFIQNCNKCGLAIEERERAANRPDLV